MPNEHINLTGIDPPNLPTAQIPLAYVAPPPLPQQGAPSPEQIANLQQTGDSYRVISKTAAVANFSGITTLIIALGSASFTAFDPGIAGVLATVILAAVGTVELVGRKKLLRGDASATRILAFNQLAFLAAIIIYCCMQMAMFSLSSLTKEIPPELGPIDPSTQQLIRQLWNGFYILLIFLSLVFQGGLALYYHRKAKHVDRFRSAQDWEKDLLIRIGR